MSTREHAGRALVDARSQGGRCELCGRLGTNVHHRMRQGRPWHGANLLRVCGAGNASGCHGWIETHPEHATVLGLIVRRGQDSRVVPVYCRPVMFPLGWWLPDDDGMWTPFPGSQPALGGQLFQAAAISALHVHLNGQRAAR